MFDRVRNLLRINKLYNQLRDFLEWKQSATDAKNWSEFFKTLLSITEVKEMLTSLQGYKTYIVAALVGLVIALQQLGYITGDQAKTLLEILGAAGAATLAAKINRNAKVEILIIATMILFATPLQAQSLREQAKNISSSYADKLVKSQSPIETSPTTEIDKSLSEKWLKLSEGIFIGVQSADTVAYVVMHAQSVVNTQTGTSQPSIIQQNPVLPNGAVGVIAAKAAVTTGAVLFCEDLWNKGLKVEAIVIFIGAAAATFASDVKPVYDFFRGVTPVAARHNSVGLKFAILTR